MSDQATIPMNHVLYWIRQELESSGFDRVVVDTTNNFFCMGEGQPDSFDGFRMIYSHIDEELPIAWSTYANR